MSGSIEGSPGWETTMATLLEGYDPHRGEEHIEPGIIYAPYVPVTTATYINGEMVWNKNRWINLGLKIKRFFRKPKYLKNIKKYSEKTINPKYYKEIKLNDGKDS